MVLTETENKVLNYLRYPTHRINKVMQDNNTPIDDLSDEEIVSLYNKMDAIIEDEGNMRRSLGSLDEMYIIELSCIKDFLIKEINNRGLNISMN